MAVSQRVRNLALPVAMVVGAVFHNFFDHLGFLPPYLVFGMLVVTFTRVSPREIRITPLHLILLAVQVLGGVLVYMLLRGFDVAVAQGLMMCVFAPTAMASVVIAGMLGANVTTMATLCLFSNACMAVIAPVWFAAIGVNPDMQFMQSVLTTLSRVGPLLILPFFISWGLKKVAPKWHKTISEHQEISFWLWALSLIIVTARMVKFIISQPPASHITTLILAAGSLVLCLVQFPIGRYIGRRYGDTVAGGQALGQKNNVLAIWMSQTFLDPLSSVGPAVYVIWQNIVNSWQLWRYKKK